MKESEDEIIGWHHQCNGHEFGQTWGHGDLTCFSPWGHKELDMTGQPNNNNFIYIYIYAHTYTAAKSLQSCLTLYDPTYSSPPGSPIPGILQARTLEWVEISFSNAWKWKMKVKSLSCVWLLPTSWTAAYQAPPSLGFSRQEYWSGLPLPSPWSSVAAAAAAAKSLQSCPALCNPMDSSPPGSPIPGILQARPLEWVAISFSNA